MSTFATRDTAALGEKTSAALARVIRAAILDGRLEPRRALREEELARELGTSRTPIREALLLLEHEGLVESARNRGTTVRAYDASDLEDAYSLRAVLEGYAARAAAERITTVQLARLEESCRRFARLCEAGETLPELVDENLSFHETIVEAAGSPRLRAMLRGVTAVPLIYKSYMTYSDDNRWTAERHHRGILAALAARDANRAAALMEGHVLWARDVAVAHLPLIVGDGAVSAATATPATRGRPAA